MTLYFALVAAEAVLCPELGNVKLTDQQKETFGFKFSQLTPPVPTKK